MVQGAFKVSEPMSTFNDVESLRKYLNSQVKLKRFAAGSPKHIARIGQQLSTDADIEFVSDNGGAIAISQKGMTELTLVGAFAEDNGDNNDFVATLVYVDNTGAEHTATCTVTEDHNDTEVAFVDATTGTAVTDYYATVSLTSNQAVNTGDTFSWGATGALGLPNGGALGAGLTTATEANMGGVGNVYIRSAANHADGQDKTIYLVYITPWGEIKYATGTTDDSDATVEERLFDDTSSASVKDFHRLIAMYSESTPSGDSGEFYLCDDALANVNGSGNDVFGIIDEDAECSVSTRIYAPLGFRTFVGDMCISVPLATPGDSYICTLHCTPKGMNAELSYECVVGPNYVNRFIGIELEPGTDAYISLIAIADDYNISVCIEYFLCEEV